MNGSTIVVVLGLACAAVPVIAQENVPAATLRQTSRAVLVDVIVTDSSGKLVTGLSKDAFTVTEQGKRQKISFFEENDAARPAQPVEMPTLPPDVFTNFSPFPQPPAVNVLLLDSLNTHLESQMYVHSQTLKFLKSAKPGTRTAIFTMGLGLHFIQGFNDDPAVLAEALNGEKNNEVTSSVMLESADPQNLTSMMSAPDGNGGTGASLGAIAGLSQFLKENAIANDDQRMWITLANLQRLAAFLEGFPGRKNIIWFSEKSVGVFKAGGVTGNPAMDDEIKKTLAMLATARAAIYPVDARGTSNYGVYTAEKPMSNAITLPSQVVGGNGALVQRMGSDDANRKTDQFDAQLLAEQSGGQAFANINGLSDVIDKVTANSGYFYTLSYSPTDAKMNGDWRKIDIKVEGGKYNLSYRRGYFAVDAGLPGSSMSIRNLKLQTLAAQNPGAVDPLLPYMDLGMPQSEQILCKILVVPAAVENEPAGKKDKNHYKLDFAIDMGDLDLKLAQDGLHKGTLNVSLIVYDRYGNIASREDHIVQLNIKPDLYAVLQNTGVPLHFELGVPKGNFWLRTGIFDQRSHKVGTMEIPLSAVKPLKTTARNCYHATWIPISQE